MEKMTEQEFEALVDRVSPFLFKVLAPWAFSREVIEDIVQEVWIKVHKALPGFRGGSGIQTWIYRIAVNTAASWRRKRGAITSENLERLPDGRSRSDPEAESGRRILREKIRIAVERLRPAEREVFLLRAWDDRSFSEIAGILGSSEGSVRVRYFKVIRKLRKALAVFREDSHDDIGTR